MALIDTLNETKENLESLVTYSNEVTGANDTDISSCIASLVSGFGQGGSSMNIVKATYENTSENNFSYTHNLNSSKFLFFARVREIPETVSKNCVLQIWGIYDENIKTEYGLNNFNYVCWYIQKRTDGVISLEKINTNWSFVNRNVSYIGSSQGASIGTWDLLFIDLNS